jgi:hypothetical protein
MNVNNNYILNRLGFELRIKKKQYKDKLTGKIQKKC